MGTVRRGWKTNKQISCFMLELTGFENRLNVGSEQRDESRMTPKCFPKARKEWWNNIQTNPKLRSLGAAPFTISYFSPTIFPLCSDPFSVPWAYQCFLLTIGLLLITLFIPLIPWERGHIFSIELVVLKIKLIKWISQYCRELLAASEGRACHFPSWGRQAPHGA